MGKINYILLLLLGSRMGWGSSPELPWSSLRNTEESVQISGLPIAAGGDRLPRESYMEKKGVCIFLPHNLAKKKHVNEDGRGTKR